MGATFIVLAIVVGVACIVLVTLPRTARGFDRGYRYARRIRLAIGVLGGVLAVAAAPCLIGTPVSDECASTAIVAAVGLVALGAVLPALQRRPAVDLRPRRVLAIGAHPDDLELACGATLAKLIDDGHEVRTIVMSSGESGGRADLRAVEAELGSGYLGAAPPRQHRFCDTRLDLAEHDMVVVLEREIAEFAPDIVITHSANDYHQDHTAVHRATMRAARRQPTIVCFESPSATPEFAPRFFVDVAEYLDVKARAIAIHRDQRGKAYMRGDLARGTAVFRGAQGRVEAAEGFEVVRMHASSVGEL